MTVRPVGDGDGQDGLRGLLTTTLRGCVYPVDLVGVTEHLLPVVTAWADARARERAAEELRAAADSYESDDEQPAINRLADEVYRPGDCLSSLWLRARADALAADDRTGQR